ncbi:MAG: NAD-dependent epimerase/dehydratase family protein [Nocardioides sp.]
MRILIIGGTHFVGYAMAEAAVQAGHDVSLLHRNTTAELPGATHLLADRNGDLSVLDGLSFDATIDVCAYVPGQVRSLRAALGDRGGHHLFISTVSVYTEPDAPGADEDSPLFEAALENATEVTNETYGPLKVTCENVATEVYGASSLTLIRPTYVVGPRDKTARYPWWPLRAARGGAMIAPGPSEAPMQYIDARDMGAWTVRLAEGGVSGTFTAAAPATTFGAMLDETVGAVDSDARLVQVDGDWLVEHGIDGLQLPLWTEGSPEFSLAMATGRAQAAGLECRPFSETVRDTLAWAQANPDDATDPQWGMAPERERELLASWAASS